MTRTLYLVKFYNHRKNQWAQFLVTVPAMPNGADMAAQAQDIAMSTLSKDFEHRTTEAICHSDREVFKEI